MNMIMDALIKGIYAVAAFALACLLAGPGQPEALKQRHHRPHVSACRVTDIEIPEACTWWHRAPICGDGVQPAGTVCYWQHPEYGTWWYSDGR